MGQERRERKGEREEKTRKGEWRREQAEGSIQNTPYIEAIFNIIG